MAQLGLATAISGGCTHAHIHTLLVVHGTQELLSERRRREAAEQEMRDLLLQSNGTMQP